MFTPEEITQIKVALALLGDNWRVCLICRCYFQMAHVGKYWTVCENWDCLNHWQGGTSMHREALLQIAKEIYGNLVKASTFIRRAGYGIGYWRTNL